MKMNVHSTTMTQTNLDTSAAMLCCDLYCNQPPGGHPATLASLSWNYNISRVSILNAIHQMVQCQTFLPITVMSQDELSGSDIRLFIFQIN